MYKRQVGHLDADGVLARDWRYNADAGGGQSKLEIVIETRDPADLGTRGQRQLEQGHGRAGQNLDDTSSKDPEALERLFDLLGFFFQRGAVGSARIRLAFLQELDRGQLVGAVALLRLGLAFLFWLRFSNVDDQRWALGFLFRFGQLGGLRFLLPGCLLYTSPSPRD